MKKKIIFRAGEGLKSEHQVIKINFFWYQMICPEMAKFGVLVSGSKRKCIRYAIKSQRNLELLFSYGEINNCNPHFTMNKEMCEETEYLVCQSMLYDGSCTMDPCFPWNKVLEIKRI